MLNAKHQFAVISIILLLALSACSSGSSSPTPAAPATSAAPTSAPTSIATDTPVQTDTAVPTATATTPPTTEPTDTPAAVQSAGACLVGKWKFGDMSNYFASILARTGGQAQFVGQTGDLTYDFGSDGKATIAANNFAMNLKITAQGLSLPIAVSITGTATANYTTGAPNKITFTDSQYSGLTFSAKMNDQELFSGSSAELGALFGSSTDPKYSTVTYECSGDTIMYTPPLANAKPVTLTRVSP